MRLLELDAQLERIVEPGRTYDRVDTLAEAQGVLFECPKCFKDNGGPVGTHMVLCWFRGRGVPDTEKPKPGRWAVSGTGLADLTLHPSVHLIGAGCGWHGWVKNGDAA